MLYTLRLLIGAQKVVRCSAENYKLIIGFSLQALELSRHRLYARTDIKHLEQDWLLTLENYVSNFLHCCDLDEAEDAIVMYVKAIKSAGVKFYGGAYPLVLVVMLCDLCIKSERLKASQGRELVEICAEILLSLTTCLNKLAATVDLMKGLLFLLTSVLHY